MKTRKRSEFLKNLIAQQDEQKYERVKICMKVAAKIADTLKEKGLSQKEFAEKMGKKPSEISKWLSGTHNFTLNTLVDIQTLLGLELISIRSKAVICYEIVSKISLELPKQVADSFPTEEVFAFTKSISQKLKYKN